MSWNGRMRRLPTLAASTALLLGTACGGGDKRPTGPGGEQGPDSFELVSLGRVGLPADVALEDCTLTRFYGGRLDVTEDGSWRIALQVHDDNYGDWGYLDEGEIEEDGAAVWFDSGVSGASYQGAVDGSEVRIMYDWCYNGVPDVQLVFDR
jgi:hypothetical protein